MAASASAGLTADATSDLAKQRGNELAADECILDAGCLLIIMQT